MSNEKEPNELLVELHLRSWVSSSNEGKEIFENQAIITQEVSVLFAKWILENDNVHWELDGSNQDQLFAEFMNQYERT